ncbi:sensor histidine kinase [Ideonella livida]|uniref:sensor histidine kinase n=1 Tax=Ideonella livida TaxID=2707176 RepID=UPI001EF31500|nr:ATP-binding protein [Ideonella livida]
MADLSSTLQQFIPHGFCLSWEPRLVALHLISDGVTALAYATIPFMLIKLVRARSDLQFSWMFVLFGAFILACGATHAMSIWTLWHPDYLAAGLVKALTALVSVGTAAVLWPLIPRAIALPGPAQWEAVHQDLRRQINDREAAEQEVRRLNAELEVRVAARTAELQEAHDRLSALHAELEQRVRDRTQELEQAQAALVATARQAGMAEVATNVLHNVGNVLNSVNVSVGLMGQQLRQSRLGGLGRTVGLLAEHRADLGAFMGQDPRGQMLPDYLARLDTTLQDEQRALQHELEGVAKSLDHLKDVVATQQTYAGHRQMLAPVRVDELVQDALRMNAGALSRHQVRVELALQELPPRLLDRHRVLQILVNLISNAKQAMDAKEAGGHTLKLSAHQDEEGTLHLAVQDQGDGIAPENLTRIFHHGFTTRAQGHGFGLHSCVLAAREMGGELRVHSDGPGHGATFTLVLPRVAPPADPSGATPSPSAA